MLGFYIHVPFCHGKCPYCDFYSRPDSPRKMDAYVSAVVDSLAPWRERLAGRELATVYFGGGTPSLLGAERLGLILQAVRQGFSLTPGTEITLEANPTSVDRAFFQGVRQAGFNRLSMGLQSANEEELRFLGRAHSPQQAAQAVENARAAGFSNISLDLMLGLPGGSREKLAKNKSVELSTAYESCTMDGKVTVYAMAEYMGLKPDTVRRRLKADGGYWVDGADVGRKEPGSNG